ncbi:hypothetical protein [Paracoccus onubensis]|uniref:hypothetical protein n=1 Tax=Paracoccus onubensis TaxID=1675788 RepID=UPI0011C48E85|nr:hypothetical protein [Paracoccus onubensis]
MKPIEVYRSDHLNCICYKENSDNLSIVFDHMRTRDGNFPKHGYPIYHKNTALLHVHCKDNNWFLVPDLNKARRAIAEFSKKYSRITAFGSSMGGYGAVLFSKKINYDFVFLASPQFSIFPKIAPFDDRFTSNLEKTYGNCELKTISRKTINSGLLIYDSSITEDRLHKDLFSIYFPEILAVSFPFSGHPALSIFGDTGKFGKLANMIVNDDISRRDLILLRRDLREESQTYLKNILSYLDKRNER